MKKLALHTKILIGLALGFLWGYFAIHFNTKIDFNLVVFTINYIKPFGIIFINLLTLLAIPLIIASLITGISGLKDIRKLSKMGGKTLAIYLGSTAIAVTVGLLAVNIISPGNFFPEETRIHLQQQYEPGVTDRLSAAEQQLEQPPLQPLVNLVPTNLFSSLQDNRNMLQIVLFTIFFGIVLMLVPPEKSSPIIAFFEGANEVLLKMIHLIMYVAPYGVFALIAALMAEFAGEDPSSALDILTVLFLYAITVIIGLAFLVIFFYPTVLKLFAGMPYMRFIKGILPAQLLAFSTSSSAATLPVTMERCEKKLGLREEVVSFVLPLGATINMDGTSLYQAVAAVFIAQAFGHDLTIVQQLTIVLTATMASIGAAGVPGAGIIMLVIVLQSVGLDPAGIALVLAVDRPLDMCRTVVNVTGDATVATIVDHTENLKTAQ